MNRDDVIYIVIFDLYEIEEHDTAESFDDRPKAAGVEQIPDIEENGNDVSVENIQVRPEDCERD